MLFVKLEDMNDNTEVLVFNDTIEATKDVWVDGTIIEVKGRMSKKDGDTKLICYEAKKI